VADKDAIESGRMDEVNAHPNGPTEPDEMEVLAQHFAYDESVGTFHGWIGDDDEDDA
jgi:hypothetical protein